MEPQNQFTTVTKASRILAAVLFIVLPFVGLYIGYTYAPEKVVEVERVVVKEVEVEKIVEAETFTNNNQIHFLHNDVNPLATYVLVDGKLYVGVAGPGTGGAHAFQVVDLEQAFVQVDELEINTEKVPLLIHQNNVYYRDTLLEGISAVDMQFGERYIFDEDTIYFIRSNCSTIVVTPGTFEEKDSFYTC